MLLAEELLLLLTDETTGRFKVDGNKRRLAIGGALLAELAMRERIGVTAHDLGWRERDRLQVLLERTTEDPILDTMLVEVAKYQGKKPSEIISRLNNRRFLNKVETQLMERLVNRGILTQEKGHALGIFPTTTHPEADPAPEAEVRARLNAALLRPDIPQVRTAALVSLLHATGTIKKVLSDETDPKQAARRAKEIAESDWTSREVARAIQQLSAATVAVVAASS